MASIIEKELSKCFPLVIKKQCDVLTLIEENAIIAIKFDETQLCRYPSRREIIFDNGIDSWEEHIS